MSESRRFVEPSRTGRGVRGARAAGAAVLVAAALSAAGAGCGGTADSSDAGGAGAEPSSEGEAATATATATAGDTRPTAEIPFGGPALDRSEPLPGLVVERFAEPNGSAQAAAGAGDVAVIRFEVRLAGAGGAAMGGRVIDSTARRGGSAGDGFGRLRVALGVPGAVRGLQVGLLGMREGEARRVTVPAELGYGSRGRPPIPAGAVLVFDAVLDGVEAGGAGPVPEGGEPVDLPAWSFGGGGEK